MMANRGRWFALAIGAAYIGIGVASWLGADGDSGPGVSRGALMLALWAAIGILWIGFARPNLFGLTSPGVGPWLALSLAAPLALVPFRDMSSLSALPVVVFWPIAILPLGIALAGRESRASG